VRRLPAVIDGLAGGLWWNFHDGSASMIRFAQEVLAYTTRRPWDEIVQLSRADLSAEGTVPPAGAPAATRGLPAVHRDQGHRLGLT